VPVLKRFVRLFLFHTIGGCAPLLLAALVMLVATGCSSRKHKSHPHSSPTITTTTLPDAMEGVSYSATIEATGGATPYTWSVSGLPSGLSWSQVGDTVEISGTPASGTAGTYSVDVAVTDSSSPTQSDNATLRLVVNSASGSTTLKVDFDASPTEGKAPLTVDFTDKSTGNPTSWEWDFDNDGTVDSTEQNPQWTYNNPGWYTVKLTVSDGTSTVTCVKEKFIQVGTNVYYVNGVNGDDTNGGTGWNDAFRTIWKALDVASDYDLVLVADTTYDEWDLDFNGRKIYLKGVDHNTAGQRPVIDCQRAGRAFYFVSSETEDSVIDNFVIQNGRVEDTYGGGVVCENNSSPTITNCVFQNNKTEDRYVWQDEEYGGAIYCNSSSPTLTNCVFNNNSASMSGGAIFCDSSAPSITNCTFSGNRSAMCGGAIYCYNSSDAEVSNCVFSGNTANWDGGAIYCNHSAPSVTGCTFNDNSVENYGGAIDCYYSSPTITNCVFSGNSANNCNGGAISGDGSSPTLSNCTLNGNTANWYGGAVDCHSSSPTLNNCILWGNSAGSGGDEIYIADSGSSCTLNYCCVDNNGYGFAAGGTIDDSNNCIFADPQFVDAAGGDYHLQDTSPCIDAGDNSYVPSGVTTDLDGNPRIVNGTVDIGAYEYQP